MPFLFDPGQGLPKFSGGELREFVRLASWVAVNSYEAEMLMRKTGWNRGRICDETRALIVTEGASGRTDLSFRPMRTHTARQGFKSRGSDRLRRRLPGGSGLRYRAQMELAGHRTAGRSIGRHQGGQRRHPESSF